MGSGSKLSSRPKIPQNVMELSAVSREFRFLSGFNQLKNLTICSCFRLQFCLPSLPPLPSLTILDLSHITGLAEIETFPNLVNGLQFASFIPYEADDDEMWNDATVNNLVDWILLSSSDSLEFLTLKDNKYMTEVPHQIPFFTSLKYLNMANNRIHAVSRGALSFHKPVNFLNLNHNKIRSIQPGAFHGKHILPCYHYDAITMYS